MVRYRQQEKFRWGGGWASSTLSIGPKNARSTSAPAQCYLRCYYTNAQSLMNKLHKFESHIDLYKPDIIAITETWCPPILPEDCPAVEAYHDPFRQDRVSSHGGGVQACDSSVLKRKSVFFRLNMWSLRSMQIR